MFAVVQLAYDFFENIGSQLHGKVKGKDFKQHLEQVISEELGVIVRIEGESFVYEVHGSYKIKIDEYLFDRNFGSLDSKTIESYGRQKHNPT